MKKVTNIGHRFEKSGRPWLIQIIRRRIFLQKPLVSHFPAKNFWLVSHFRRFQKSGISETTFSAKNRLFSTMTSTPMTTTTPKPGFANRRAGRKRVRGSAHARACFVANAGARWSCCSCASKIRIFGKKFRGLFSWPLQPSHLSLPPSLPQLPPSLKTGLRG